MLLTFVDAQENMLSVNVDNEDHARRVFEESLSFDPWLGATLREGRGRFVTSFQRLKAEVDTHPSISQEMIEDALNVRRQVRMGDELNVGETPWFVPGLCHEVSEYIEQVYGLARTSGTIMARDLVTPICLHYWNVLPDMTIVDMTVDQLQEGSDFRIIPAGHPDWYRYQPEYECVEDLADDKGGKGFYSDELIDFILETAERVGRNRAGLREYLQCPAPSRETMERLHPLISEHLFLAIGESERYSRKAFEESFDY